MSDIGESMKTTATKPRSPINEAWEIRSSKLAFSRIDNQSIYLVMERRKLVIVKTSSSCSTSRTTLCVSGRKNLFSSCKILESHSLVSCFPAYHWNWNILRRREPSSRKGWFDAFHKWILKTVLLSKIIQATGASLFIHSWTLHSKMMLVTDIAQFILSCRPRFVSALN